MEPCAAGRSLLFVYGQLKPGIRPPLSLSRYWEDRVRGDLFDLGDYPAAVRIDSSQRWIEGFVLDVSEQELAGELDAYEDVGLGLYRRIRTTTERGTEVWVYEYARGLPPNARGPITSWRPGG